MGLGERVGEAALNLVKNEGILTKSADIMGMLFPYVGLTKRALDMTDFTSKSGVSEEWLERFMDSAGFVSSEDIQLIWGKILGKEFERPETTPPNMIRILSEMTTVYAQAFKKICSMQVIMFPINDKAQVSRVERKIMVPYRKNEKTMERIGLSFSIMNELETLGLIKFTLMGDYATTKIPEKKIIVYVDGESDTIIEHDNDYSGSP